MGTLNLAILGAGKIAETMARTIAGLEDVKAYAVASRDLKKAEEFAEKIKSIGVRDTDKNKELYELWLILDEFASKFKKGYFDEEVSQIDRVEALDADIDLAVVALGGAYSIGADVQGACHEVADSNLSKYPIVNGEYVVMKDENGKIMKPATYRKPELAPFLK